MNQRELAQKELETWVESEGGVVPAALKIQAKFECSFSKAEKIASGRYTSALSASEQRELAALMKKPRDEVFRIVKKRA